ncbi:hypothetical protein ACGF7U_31505 [Micromonospora sp. NPDC047670]|uniref:hypothetical protein n=1 Tax=Micromonospora sp. NPDC047670 TaxID=3364252 RepID=UPI00371F71D1
MNPIIGALRRLTGRSAPQPPAQPSAGQRFQEREQRAAKTRLLDLARQRQSEYRYERPAR